MHQRSAGLLLTKRILGLTHFLMQIDFEAPVVDLRWAGLNHDYDRVSSTCILLAADTRFQVTGILLYILTFLFWLCLAVLCMRLSCEE